MQLVAAQRRPTAPTSGCRVQKAPLRRWYRSWAASQSWAIESLAARLLPDIMPVTPDDLAALEERLLAKLQPSRAEEVDLPAAVYSRVMCLTAALLVYVCASMLVSSFTTGVVGNLSQIEYLVFPLCFTAQFGLMFGALDSDAAGRRTIKLMRAWWIPQIFIVPYLYWSSGMQEDAVLLFVGFAINSIYWPWLLNAIRELLRTRYQGSRTAWAQHYTSRALRLGAFQIVLAVSAIAQGLRGKESFPRVYATFNFSLNLSTVLIYVTAIFDACAVDTRAAATLRLSPLQTAALVSCGVVVLSGLAGRRRGVRSSCTRGHRFIHRLRNFGTETAVQKGRTRDVPQYGVFQPIVLYFRRPASVGRSAKGPIRRLRERAAGQGVRGPRGWCV